MLTPHAPVAITYLHHTHPEVHHFDADSWTFVKGALATVDRDFGFVGRHLFHGIIDTHVVHHLFPSVHPLPPRIMQLPAPSPPPSPQKC